MDVGGGRPISSEGDGKHAVVVLLCPRAVKRHREPALSFSTEPCRGGLAEAVQQDRFEVAPPSDPHRVARTFDAVHGLAHLAHLPSFKRELLRHDNCLVADVGRHQSRLLPESTRRLRQADRSDASPDCDLFRVEAVQKLGTSGRAANHIARDDRDARDDPIREHRLVIAGKDECHVLAQGEVREPVVRVAAQDSAGELAVMMLGGVRRRHWAQPENGCDDDRYCRVETEC